MALRCENIDADTSTSPASSYISGLFDSGSNPTVSIGTPALVEKQRDYGLSDEERQALSGALTIVEAQAWYFEATAAVARIATTADAVEVARSFGLAGKMVSRIAWPMTALLVADSAYKGYREHGGSYKEGMKAGIKELASPAIFVVEKVDQASAALNSFVEPHLNRFYNYVESEIYKVYNVPRY